MNVWKLNDMICFLRLHVQLMDLQQKQINALAEWLTLAEQRINSSESIGSDLDTVKRQVENHKVWHLISLSTFYTPVVIGVCWQLFANCSIFCKFPLGVHHVRWWNLKLPLVKCKEVKSSRLLPSMFTIHPLPHSPRIIRWSLQWQTYESKVPHFISELIHSAYIRWYLQTSY